MHSYVAYGLRFRSALPLPELREARWDGQADVRIVPMEERLAISLPQAELAALLVWQTEGDVVLRWPSFGVYRVRQGQRIEYAPLPSVSEAAVRVPLLGVCMGILLHQRGLLTLHASAVAVNGGAIAFVGEKGVGKSTTTAALTMRGHKLLADDVVAIASGGSGEALKVSSGLAVVKLWPDSVEALAIDPGKVPLLHEGVEKRVLRISEHDNPRDVPLRCVYVLERGEAITSAPFQTREAFSELVRHTYAARFLGAAAGGPRHFQQCSTLLQQVPLRRLARSDDMSQLDRLMAQIEAEWTP